MTFFSRSNANWSAAVHFITTPRLIRQYDSISTIYNIQIKIHILHETKRNVRGIYYDIYRFLLCIFLKSKFCLETSSPLPGPGHGGRDLAPHCGPLAQFFAGNVRLLNKLCYLLTKSKNQNPWPKAMRNADSAILNHSPFQLPFAPPSSSVQVVGFP